VVFLVLSCKDIEDSSNIFLSVKDSFCNKHCRISLHDVGGKLVQTLDSGVGWGWGWRNLHWNGDRDGEFFVGMGKISWGRDGDGENFIYRVTL